MTEAGRRIDEVVDRLPDELPLFVAFYWADNGSGAKEPAQVRWFVERLRDRRLEVALRQVR